jgi:hypothetical protein
MSSVQVLWPLLREAVGLYWLLIRIVVPVLLLTRLAVEAGLIEILAPLFAPLMILMGLPPELGFAWATCLLVGIWAGAAAAFAIVPAEAMTTAQVTIFASVMLIAHALPIEQRIAQKAGPGFWATSGLRVIAAILYGMILNHLFRATGWLSEAASPLWVPSSTDPSWAAFAGDTAQSLMWMFVILLGLVLLLRGMEAAGITRWLKASLSPLLRVAGISASATPLTTVGLLLGISYGGALIIQEARAGHLSARDVFLSVSLMGLSHGLIEDTLIVVAFGADLTSVLVGRVVFSLALVFLLARAISRVPDATFFRFLFNRATALREPGPVQAL